jgi:hypothetical protein
MKCFTKYTCLEPRRCSSLAAMKANTLVSMAVLVASFHMAGCATSTKLSIAGPHAGVLGSRLPPGGLGIPVNRSRIKVLTDNEGINQNVVWWLDPDQFGWGEQPAVRQLTSIPNGNNPRTVPPRKYKLHYKSLTNPNVTFSPPSPQEITLNGGEFYRVWVDFD